MANKCKESGKTIMTKKEAQTFLNSHKDKKLRIYECPLGCNGWHLTHDIKKEGGREREVKLTYRDRFLALLKGK